jgi:hypothetical protein
LLHSTVTFNPRDIKRGPPLSWTEIEIDVQSDRIAKRSDVRIAFALVRATSPAHHFDTNMTIQ